MDNQNNKKKRGLNIGVYILSLVLIGLLIFGLWRLAQPTPKTLTYGDLYDKALVETNEITVQAIRVGGDNEGLYSLSGTIKETGADGKTTIIMFQSVLTNKQYDSLTTKDNPESKILLKNVTMQTRSSNLWLTIIINLLPIVIIVGFLIWMSRSQGGNKAAFDFAKSTARLSRGKSVTFNDVAGCDEEKQELVEIVDFLKNPRKYVEIGARIPKGVLLVGNPGTGKTLIAKAVAGEAGVPFFTISGSDFVEMFVGVGASRVRDLFKQAKENAPCIVFIDEIDAVGRQRGAGMGGGHDEREQTLNQLLVEMDGFTTNIGIIMMAATNRPDVLDPALLRPGRFDRQITIPLPDVKGREEILRVHARNKKFAEDVNFEDIAHRIPGFSGAEIENLLNEAALLAARGNRKVIDKFDIDEATDRVMMGPAKKSRKMTDAERDRIAHHEAGHAVIGLKLEHSNVVQKVTIIPRGQAGGYALMLPEEETYLSTKRDLLDRITGYLGGRVAEEITYGEVSTGASNDFEMATKIARSMVTEFGMSNLGPMTYEKQGGSVFLGRDYLKEKDFSDQIALEIDKETRRIIEECYEEAKACLLENKELLETIAKYLKAIETLTKTDIDEINETLHLKWYDEKEKAKETSETEPVENKEENNQDTSSTPENE